ncbi:polysaccharide biosynthesis/export family protein [Dongia sedimenti]|uniref:Polysaccharide biosynthesis/export family protein n=1 Tax=Dongia sedimenti TaxID=3064282 RepID=A0ABU0YR49_9PROT|nr:polysaccharide biosynthesis/export family protein [Rhodospirillaceae bacterium R-7]
MKRLLNHIASIMVVVALTAGSAIAQQTLPVTTTPASGTPAPASPATATPVTETPAAAAAAAPDSEAPAVAVPATATAAPQPLYRINGGDTLHISVYGERDLDRDVAVEPDGGIAFPLVGNMNARGLTLSELQKKIADALRNGNMLPNVTDPEVTVSLVKSSGNSFSVIGQVKQPGTYVTDTQVDVMQALSLAGGLTPFASKSRIIVLRRDNSGVQNKLPFDYSAVEDGEKLNMNILLQGGDVVVVPQAGLGF